ncbi:unnamed protein product [Soboliphyme baturini]|uniref:Uncharacterized protein n=1 Tax=Soboliphyme baturini TaxID=241478 RepID=A0A183I9Q3_9BILA|nr:unnamed protein product [Soboliphyme baturini]
MNRGPSLKNFEPGYKLLKWAFLEESLALRVSTWSGIDIRKNLGIQPLLLQIEKSQLRWLGLLLKWAFLNGSLALRVSTWSGIVTFGRALEYSLCFSRLRSHSCDGLGMCCECY